MPTINYNPTAPAETAPGGFQNIQANPNAFGAAQGRALEALGTQFEKVADTAATTAFNIQKEFDQTAAREASIQAQSTANKIFYGDPDTNTPGYFGLEGRAALDARPATLKTITSLYDEARGKLSASQQREFDKETARVRLHSEALVLQHASKEFSTYQKKTEEAATTLKLDNVGRASLQGDKETFDQNLGEALKLNADAMVRQGASREQVEAKTKDIMSAAVEMWSRGRATTDPAGALAALEANKEHFTDPTRYNAVYNAVKGKADEAAGRQLVERTRSPRGGMVQGGAVATRVAQEAERQGVDKGLAVAVADIESSMGSNLGRRGNIFQLGNTEWASVGGGQKGETETDVKNGIAFLANKQKELRAALGREPSPGEVYLAHQQGTAGAVKLLKNPETPAGLLVPTENIRANGGDPNAPASAFINKWDREVNRRLGGTTLLTEGRPQQQEVPRPLAVGDSIAAHTIRRGAAEGTEYNTAQKADSTAVSGYSPEKVRGVIEGIPKARVDGKNVVLSTGLSNADDPNDPRQLALVVDQIAALKEKGAASVTVLGVGTHEKFTGKTNDALAKIAADAGAKFAGPLPAVAGDKIHSTDAAAVVRSAIGSGAAQPIAAGPDSALQAQVARIRASGASPDQQDAAIKILGQEHTVAKLGQDEAKYTLHKDIDDGRVTTRGQVDALVTSGTISPAAGIEAVTRIQKLVAQRQAEAEAISKVAAAGNGGAPLDPKSKEDRDALNYHFETVSRAWSTLPVTAQLQNMVGYSAQHGMVPKQLQSLIRGGLHSARPEQVVLAANTLDQIRNANPQLVAELGDENDLRLATTVSTLVGGGVPAVQAVETATTALKATKVEREARADDYNDQRGKDAAARELSDDRWIKSKLNSVWTADPTVDPVMKKEFDTIAATEFQKTGNLEASRTMALDAINRIWGRTDVAGDRRYMKWAPEMVYGVKSVTPAENARWMNEQLLGEVTRGAFTDPANPITIDRLRVLPDPTRRAPTGEPVYQVWLVQPDASWKQIIDQRGAPIAWRPDWTTSAEKQRQDAAATLSVEQARQSRREQQQREQAVPVSPAGPMVDPSRLRRGAR